MRTLSVGGAVEATVPILCMRRPAPRSAPLVRLPALFHPAAHRGAAARDAELGHLFELTRARHGGGHDGDRAALQRRQCCTLIPESVAPSLAGSPKTRLGLTVGRSASGGVGDLRPAQG